MTAAPVKPQRISDWINRPPTERPDALEQRRKLWDALSKYVHDNGGWVVSVPGRKVLRIEVAPGSSLPSKLAEFGYSPTLFSTATRIVAGEIRPVNVIEISLAER